MTKSDSVQQAFERVCHAYCVPPAQFNDELGSWKLHNPQPNCYTIVQIGHTTIDSIFPFSSDLLDEETFMRVCDAAVWATKIRPYTTFNGSHAMLSLNLKMLSQTRFAVVEQGWTGNLQIIDILGVIRMGEDYARQSGYPEWVVEGFDRVFDDLLTAASTLRLMLEQGKRKIGFKIDIRPRALNAKSHHIVVQIDEDSEAYVDCGSVTTCSGKWKIDKVYPRDDVPESMDRLRFKRRDDAAQHLIKNTLLHSVYHEFLNKARRI